jgi:hypothetical protein
MVKPGGGSVKTTMVKKWIPSETSRPTWNQAELG